MTSTGEDFYIVPCENEYGNEHGASNSDSDIQSGDQIIIFDIDGELYGYKPAMVVGNEPLYYGFYPGGDGNWYPTNVAETYDGDTILIVPLEGDKENLVGFIDIPNYYALNGIGVGGPSPIIQPLNNNWIGRIEHPNGMGGWFDAASLTGGCSLQSQEVREGNPRYWYYGVGVGVYGFSCKPTSPIMGIQFEYQCGVSNTSSYGIFVAFENSHNYQMTADQAWHTITIATAPTRYPLAVPSMDITGTWSNPYLVGQAYEYQTTGIDGRYTFWIFAVTNAPDNRASPATVWINVRNVKTVRY